MKLWFIKLSVLLLVLSIFFFAPTVKVKAVDNVAGLIVSPPIIEKDAVGGASFSGIIRITNPNATTDLKVGISLGDFKASGEEGQQTFLDPATNTGSFSLAKWIKVEDSTTLKANETKEIRYSVDVPKDAEPGGHYGVIFFSPSFLNPTVLQGSGVAAVPKVGALLLVNVPGAIKYDGSIIEFKSNKKIYWNIKNIVDFLTRFQNLGTTHVKPQGDIVIKNTFGKEVARLKVNEKMGNILPDSIRKFENSWEKKYGFGIYKTQVTLAYGDGQSATASLSFWIIPWILIVIILVVLILLIWLIKHLRWGGGKASPPTNNPPAQI